MFISHRTSESEWFVDLLADRLSAEFSWQRVFVDRNSMRPGEDFMVRIDAELRRCAAMLVLIGPQWSTVKCADGRRRIDCDDDVVRYEIERALERGVLVIPVLFEGARMPSRADLPDEIRALANRHAKRVDPDHLDHDLEIIVSGLKPLLDA
ncbi:MAG TPA: toll/interleukin-1 receptor domain-containing protein [Pseudonocardiaceae bacterium]